MSNEVIDVKQLPKETVAKFVNDAAGMEVRSYSLKETAKAVRKEIKDKKASADGKLEDLSSEVKNQKKKWNDSQQKAENYSWKEFKERGKSSIVDDSPEWFGVLCFLFALLTAIIFGVFIGIGTLLRLDIANTNNPKVALLLIPSVIISAIVFIIFSRQGHKGEFENRKQKYYNEARQEKEKFDQCQEEYKNYNRSHNETLKKLTSLEKHATELEKSAAEIDAALQKHYSLGIIPPDYRDMIRVLYINRAFRNDQVDTMREATLICDRDIQHREVVDSLHEIASAINGLSSVLEDISYKISIMNAELKSIANGQDKLLSETESARYATEAVQKSQEDLIWYERQKWYRANS